MILIMLTHPFLIFHPLKDSWHELFELLIIGDLILILGVDDSHQVVKHKHDEVIVIATVPILKDYLGVGEVAVGNGLYVVHLVDSGLKLFIDLIGVCEGVFSCKIRQYSLLNVVINQFHFCSTEVIPWVEDDDIFEDVFRTVDFGLFVVHFFLKEGIEGWWANCLYNRSCPCLQLSRRDLIISDFWNGN